jgi:hypothetical protein
MIQTILMSSGISGLADWLRDQTSASPVLGGFGLFVAAVILLWLLILAVRLIVSLASGIAWRAKAQRMKAQRRPGYFFLVAPFQGRLADKSRAFSEAALDAHLSAFSFSAPYEVHGLNRSGKPARRIEDARAMMVATEADLVLWGEAVDGETKGLKLQGLVRPAGGAAADAAAFSFFVPGDIRETGPEMARLLAYGVVRQVQPALGRPEDFRPDRLEPIARRFGKLLEAHDDTRKVPVLRQLQDDYAAAALHIGETKPDGEWLQAAEEIFQKIISGGRAGDADRWVSAKLGLGRAMLALAEQRYDPVKVQEGTTHVRAALDVLRGDAKLKAADSGVNALRKAERMLENRRRFSITWPV